MQQQPHRELLDNLLLWLASHPQVCACDRSVHALHLPERFDQLAALLWEGPPVTTLASPKAEAAVEQDAQDSSHLFSQVIRAFVLHAGVANGRRVKLARTNVFVAYSFATLMLNACCVADQSRLAARTGQSGAMPEGLPGAAIVAALLELCEERLLADHPISTWRRRPPAAAEVHDARTVTSGSDAALRRLPLRAPVPVTPTRPQRRRRRQQQRASQ